MSPTKKNTPPAPEPAAILICGDMEFEVSQQARTLVNRLCPPENQAFGLEVVEGAVGRAENERGGFDNIEKVGAAMQQVFLGLQTMGFLGGAKVVWLRNPDFLGSILVDIKDWIARLTGMVKAGLPPGVCLVISAPNVDQRSALFRTFQAHGAVHVHRQAEKEYKAIEELLPKVKAWLAESDLAMDRPALDYFLARTGKATRQIRQEIEKMALYFNARHTVTHAEIELLVAPVAEAAMWDYTDAVGRRELPQALDLLHRLYRQEKSVAVPLMLMLERKFRQLLVARLCLDRRWISLQINGKYRNAEWIGGPEATAALAGLGADDIHAWHPYRLALLAEQARNYTEAEIADGQRRILAAHEAVVSGHHAQELLLELLTLQLINKGAQVK